MAITDTIDPSAALRTYLLSSSYVTDEVGASGVYCEFVPQGVTMPGKVITVLQMEGAGANPRIRIENCMFQARCYGETPKDAWEVYAGLRSALQGTKRQKIEPGVGVGSGDHWMLDARKEGGPEYMREPEAGWGYVLSTWACKFVMFPVS